MHDFTTQRYSWYTTYAWVNSAGQIVNVHIGRWQEYSPSWYVSLTGNDDNILYPV